MNKIKENKKMFAIILIISLLAVLLGSYAIYKNSNKEETTSKIEKSEKLEKKAEKKLKEAKKSGDKEEIVKAEKELKQAEEVTKSASSTSASSSSANKSKSTPTASKPSASSSSGTTSTKPSPKPKEKQKVWIVDKAAWTETVTKYRTETKYRPTWIVKTNNGIKIFYNEAEAVQYAHENYYAYSDGEDEAYTVQVPYTETINHPEEGHYVYR